MGFSFSRMSGYCAIEVYLECSKMNHIVNVGVLAEDLVQRCLVVDVNVVELRALAADELNAVDNFL